MPQYSRIPCRFPNIRKLKENLRLVRVSVRGFVDIAAAGRAMNPRSEVTTAIKLRESYRGARLGPPCDRLKPPIELTAKKENSFNMTDMPTDVLKMKLIAILNLIFEVFLHGFLLFPWSYTKSAFQTLRHQSFRCAVDLKKIMAVDTIGAFARQTCSVLGLQWSRIDSRRIENKNDHLSSPNSCGVGSHDPPTFHLSPRGSTLSPTPAGGAPDDHDRYRGTRKIFGMRGLGQRLPPTAPCHPPSSLLIIINIIVFLLCAPARTRTCFNFSPVKIFGPYCKDALSEARFDLKTHQSIRSLWSGFDLDVSEFAGNAYRSAFKTVTEYFGSLLFQILVLRIRNVSWSAVPLVVAIECVIGCAFEKNVCSEVTITGDFDIAFDTRPSTSRHWVPNARNDPVNNKTHLAEKTVTAPPPLSDENSMGGCVQMKASPSPKC
ncbi:hypothetical protein EVAR_6236_1 [Eumeta japonica]|uniref:Uncharacterized protein n=1 Tax=Eumeta variegata TaxID=151549 RepID=A0A4C1TB75_EUMVA|nr:hypothetical protein EVAR_6236_1 [Eumeta japonica]